MSDRFDIQSLAIINRVVLAYFTNILENHGVHLQEYRPTCSPTLSMVGKSFSSILNHANEIDSYIAKIVVHDKNLSDLKEKHLEDFFDEEFKDKVEREAIIFANFIKKYPLHDIIFSRMEEFPPFLSVCDQNPENSLAMRGIYGFDVMNSKHTFIFDFYCLIVERYREVERDLMNLRTFMPVSQMTDEQRKKYDVQPKKRKDEEDGLD